MKKNYQLLRLFTGLLLMTAFPALGQTFWGVTSMGSTFQGGTIFSYNVQTNNCVKEFEFKPNPVYDAFNIFEESPGVYIGACQKSFADSVGKPQNGSAIFRYDALKDSTEIVAELPSYFKHWNGGFKSGEADIIYFQGNIISMMGYGEDTMKLVSYDVANKSLKEISTFVCKSWPGDGNYGYNVSACFFTAVNDTTVLFSLGKFKQVGNDSRSNEGRDFYSYNPQTGHVGKLFNIPDSPHKVLPYGPFTQTKNGRLLCPEKNDFLEVNLADSTYSFVTPFDNGYLVNGKMALATDTTLVGLHTYGYSSLFEYDFKNDTLLKQYNLWGKSYFYNFVKRGDSLFFALKFSGGWPKIMVYHPNGIEPRMVYEQSDHVQNQIQYLAESSDDGTLLVMSNGLSNYYIQKQAYIDRVRFGYYGGNYYSYQNGARPESDLLLASNGKLYGIAPDGGWGSYSYGDGTLFEIDPKTKEFHVLVNFIGKNGGFGDRDNYGTHYGRGQNNLVEVNQKIYGTTYTNGDYDQHPGPGYGTVFTYDLSRNYDNFRKIYDFNVNDTAGNGRFPMSGLTPGANGKLYGTTLLGGSGGIYGHGVLYEIDPAQNDTFRVVIRIPDTCLQPSDNLVAADNGKMYGLATSMFTQDKGKWAIREYDVAHDTFTDIYRSVENYEKNYSQFVYHNNKLYGVVTSSSNDNNGYLFEFDLTTRKLAQRVVFPKNGSKGMKPEGNLTLSSTGTLWGYTTDRMIYEYNPADTSLTAHFRFSESIGSNPLYSCLTEVEGDHTSIRKNKRLASVKAFPNPTVEQVKFVFGDNTFRRVQYAVYDVSGRRVSQGTAQVSGYVFINFSGFKPGVYVVNLQAGNVSYSKKIIKK